MNSSVSEHYYCVELLWVAWLILAAIVSEGFIDLASDAVAVATPFLPAGSTKLGRITMEGVGVTSDAKKVSKGNGASKAVKGDGPDIGSQKDVAKVELDYKRNPKHNESEFNKQALDQAKGLEKQTAGDVKNNIESFRESGRKEANSAVAKYKKAEGKPESGNHVTHTTDCCIGGSAKDISGTGNGGINSSIGRQNSKQSNKVYSAVKGARSNAKIKVTVKVDDKIINK
ncbi:MAG: hypothetical protein ACJASU_002429 [Cognaticolwellia sp.]|jgi:hypothetical protein